VAVVVEVSTAEVVGTAAAATVAAVTGNRQTRFKISGGCQRFRLAAIFFCRGPKP
jgi:hypothetical protein